VDDLETQPQYNEASLLPYSEAESRVRRAEVFLCWLDIPQFPSSSRLLTASRSNAALSIEGSPVDGRCFLRVVVVRPSEWALLDVSTGPIYSLMYDREETVPGITMAMFQTIENCPIVRSRNAIMNCGNTFFAAPSSSGNPSE
jgi:hypothetical protein